MTTIVYQESLQSINYEPKVMEPMTLNLKVTNSSKLNLFTRPPSTSNNNNNNNNNKAWSAIESLSFSSQQREEEPIYVHPLTKRSWSNLSDKSLEMCTESLGSETGACITEDSDVFLPKVSDRTRYNRVNSHKSDKVDFPPPLTTINGLNPIHVRPYREDGRLVIKAVSAPRRESYLKAERNDGRLRLSLVRGWSNEEDEEEQVEEYYDDQQEQDQEEEKHKEEEENEEEKEESNIKENIEEKTGKEVGEVNRRGVKLVFGVRYEFGGFQAWPRRCKEGGREDNKRLINWEPFWVVT